MYNDNGANECKSVSDISETAERHQALNKQLDEALGYLESSLERVLIPEVEKATLDKGNVSYSVNAVASQPRSKLNNWMSQRNDALERAIDKVNSLRIRLDII